MRVRVRVWRVRRMMPSGRRRRQRSSMRLYWTEFERRKDCSTLSSQSELVSYDVWLCETKSEVISISSVMAQMTKCPTT